MNPPLLQLIWDRYPGRSGPLNVLMAIAGRSSGDGNCSCSMAALAHDARLSRLGTLRILAELRDQRWIVASRINGRAGRLVYQINVGKLQRTPERVFDEHLTLTDAEKASIRARRKREKALERSAKTRAESQLTEQFAADLGV